MSDDETEASVEATTDADDDLDDLAAEVDDTSADEMVDSTDDDEGFTAYAGRCEGGPYDGRVALSRCPAGFLLVDKPNALVWLYDMTGPGVFVCRGAAMVLDDDGRRRAADESDYDVIAYDADPVTL